MRRLLSQVPVVVVLCLLAQVAIAERPNGVRHHTSGGVITVAGRNLELRIPDKYKVLFVEDAHDRLLVTAYSILEEAGRRTKYLSEVWQFEMASQDIDSLSFDSRLVLVSLSMMNGERMQLCQQTVSCDEATAVYVAEWEGGRTLLFDRQGNSIDIAWPTNKVEDGDCCLDFNRPIAWVGHSVVEPPRRLICYTHFHGDNDPYLFILDWESREFERISVNQAFGKFGHDLVYSMLRQEGAY